MKVLMKGNEALSEAAIRAGATLYFGYPITPQNEVGEYMSRRLPTIPGGAYIQAETEVASINNSSPSRRSVRSACGRTSSRHARPSTRIASVATLASASSSKLAMAANSSSSRT